MFFVPLVLLVFRVFFVSLVLLVFFSPMYSSPLFKILTSPYFNKGPSMSVDIISTETRRNDVLESFPNGIMKDTVASGGSLLQLLTLAKDNKVTVAYGVEQSFRERKRGRIRRRIRSGELSNRKFIHTNPIVTSISDISMKLEGREITDAPAILSVIEKNLDTYHLNPDLIGCSYILYKRVNERLMQYKLSGYTVDNITRDKIIQQLVNKELLADLISYIRGTTTTLTMREAAEQLGIAESFITKELETEASLENIIETKIMISILAYYDYIFGGSYSSTDTLIDKIKGKLLPEELRDTEASEPEVSSVPIGPFSRRDLLLHNYGMSTWESETSGKGKKDTILKKVVQEKESTGSSVRLLGRKR